MMTEPCTPGTPEGEAPGSSPDDTPEEPMARMRDMLMTQATDLDEMFAQLIGKAATDLHQWPTTAERFVRLALRAQSNCRASLETLARAERSLLRAQEREAARTAAA
jgi:hypothetical protein